MLGPKKFNFWIYLRFNWETMSRLFFPWDLHAIDEKLLIRDQKLKIAAANIRDRRLADRIDEKTKLTIRASKVFVRQNINVDSLRVIRRNVYDHWRRINVLTDMNISFFSFSSLAKTGCINFFKQKSNYHNHTRLHATSKQQTTPNLPKPSMDYVVKYKQKQCEYRAKLEIFQ